VRTGGEHAFHARSSALGMASSDGACSGTGSSGRHESRGSAVTGDESIGVVCCGPAAGESGSADRVRSSA
jgi:hypothetical protein